MLGLAYRIERAIEEREVREQAEAARRLGVTRARLSQTTYSTPICPRVASRTSVAYAIQLPSESYWRQRG